MVSANQVFNFVSSWRAMPFFCQVVDMDDGFEIELFNRATKQTWATCFAITAKNLELFTLPSTRIPLETVRSYLKIGLNALGTGRKCENVALDMTEHTEQRMVMLHLNLRFGPEKCYWTPTVDFMLQQVDEERRERMELQAAIAAIAFEMNSKPACIISASDQHIPGRQSKARYRYLLWSFCTVALALFVIAASQFVALQAPHARGIALASVKPFAIQDHSKLLIWEPSGNFDDNVFSANQAKLKVTEPGFVQVSILLRHSNCRSDIAFKVFLGTSEIASVYDYTCGLFSAGTSTTYVHTVAASANDTLSVKYIGGGKLYMEDSFMDVLLLPSTSK